MSKIKSIYRSGITYWLFLAMMMVGFILWYFTRSLYDNAMLSEADDRLVKHESAWAGRGRDYAQYQITLWGEDNQSYQAAYRIPASVEKVPGLVVLHTICDVKAVFELLNRVENANDCAIIAINAAQFLKRDESGKLLAGNSELSSGLVTGMHAADLAIEYLRSHSVVDSSAVYLLGLDEANLLVLPAAVNHQTMLKGLVCINPAAMMSMKSWGKRDFASPYGWAGKIDSMRALLVMKGADQDELKLYDAFPATANRMNAVSQNAAEDIKTAIQWIWKDRPRGEKPAFEPGKPTKDKTTVFRK